MPSATDETPRYQFIARRPGTRSELLAGWLLIRSDNLFERCLADSVCFQLLFAAGDEKPCRHVEQLV